MKIERGTYQVTRFCCTSGMCNECRAFANGGKRKRIVQLERLSKKTAEEVAANWSLYGAKVEPMGAAK